MTSRPVEVRLRGVGRVSVLVVDTEGFHGVHERTSRTYENNLFALSYLLSSTLIYNSAYPVDAHHIDEIKGAGQSRALGLGLIGFRLKALRSVGFREFRV
jgi:hypothetical protein